MQGINIKLPKQWEVTDIGSITTLVSKVDESWPLDKRIKYVDISSIDNSKYLITTPKEFELGDAPSRARQIIQTNDVLFSTVRPYLKNIAKVPKELNNEVCSTGFSVLRSGRGFNTEYLYYYCTSTEFINSLAADQYGVSYPAVKDETVRQKLLPVPPKEEQGRIVEKIEELFSELDKGIESLKTAKAQLAVYRQALLKHAFEGRLTEQWRASNADKLESPEKLLTRIQQERETRYQQQLDDWGVKVEQWEKGGKDGKKPAKPRKFNIPEKHTDKEIKLLSQLPDEWRWGKLGSVFDVYVGATPSRKRADYWQGGIPWVSSGEVAFSTITKTSECITEKGIDNSSTVQHPIGTVMLAMIGEGKTRGQAAILEIEAAHNQNTAAIRVSETNFSSLIVYYYLMYQYEITRKLGSGNNQKALNKERVSNMNFPLFCVSEQNKLVEVIESNLVSISKIEIELDINLKRTDILRQSILKKAFSGNLVAQDPNDEPASELLKTIAIEKVELAAKEKADKSAAKIAKAEAKKAKA